MLSIICAKTSPRFCNVCGREVEQLWSRAQARCYETLYVCTDQRVSARTICKLRRTISSCCLTRNLPPILQQILLQAEFAVSIARLLEFGPREIACAFRRMLCIPFVHLPLPSKVTDCILSYLRMDNEMNVLNPVAKAKPKPKAKARGKARNKSRLMDVRLRPKA